MENMYNSNGMQPQQPEKKSNGGKIALIIIASVLGTLLLIGVIIYALRVSALKRIDKAKEYNYSIQGALYRKDNRRGPYAGRNTIHSIQRRAVL